MNRMRIIRLIYSFSLLSQAKRHQYLTFRNGPYRTRTVGDESNLEIARTQIEALLSLASVADNEKLQELVCTQ
jgi:hypothetical protein